MPQEPDPIIETALMRQKRESLRQAVELYNKINAEECDRPALDLSLHHSVDGVLREIRSLQTLHKKSSQKPWWKSLEVCCTNFARCEAAINSFMHLLPSESWQGSLICGSLKVIFGAIARVGHFRKDVERILERLPIAIEKVNQYVHIYRNRTLVKAHVTNLYVLLLEVVQQCLDFYATKTWKKLVNALGSGDQYGAALKEKAVRLSELERRMDDSAAISGQAGVMRIEQKVDIIGATLLNSVQDMFLGQEALMEKRLELEQARMRLEEERAAMRRQQRKQQKALAEMQMQRRVDIQRYIDYDEVQYLDDQIECLQMVPVNFLGVHERSDYMLGTQELIQWAHSTKSEVLLVNANEDEHGAGESAVSMFSAVMLQSFDEDMKDVVKLSWFAGRHPLESPTKMVSALLGQLVAQGKATPSAEIMKEVDLLSLQDVEAVAELFRHWLQAQLLLTDVFCICDSVSCYEDAGRLGDLLSVYNVLMDVVEEDYGVHKLKVLLTSPTSCSHIGTVMDERNPATLTIPEMI